jgi:hypothetical protein
MITGSLNITRVLGFVKKMKEMASKLADALDDSNTQEQVQEIILQEIHAAIDEVGLTTNTGHLKSSFKFVGVEKGQTTVTYKVISTARYASYLNDGSAPSYGRYVPAIGKRLINGEAGMHPGNRPYRFMELAQRRVAERLRPTLTQQITSFIKKWLS